MLLLLSTALAQQFEVGPLDPTCDGLNWGWNASAGCNGSEASLLDFGGARGSMWWDQPVAFSPESAFRSRFRVSIPCANFCPSGLTFTLQSSDLGALGVAGLGLGYQGIDDSVGVEFDLFDSASWDFPANNHVGVNLHGNTESIGAAAASNIGNGFFHGWVDYDPHAQTLSVFTNGGPTKPSTPALIVALDVHGAVGSSPWVGFTAGNDFGSGASDVRIETFHLEVDVDVDGDGLLAFEDPCDIDPVDAPIDVDCDGVSDPDDLCPGFDDALDGDFDVVPDGCDLCPATPDDQTDTDGDGLGDACDPCPTSLDEDPDGDGVCGDDDLCPGFDDTIDSDGDGAPDCVDVCPMDALNDSDGDGACDSEDNCPDLPNVDQSDADGDGVGDACDPLVDTGGMETGDTDTETDVPPPDTDDPLHTGDPGALCEDCDGDGFTMSDGDCDDTDPSVYPGALEADDAVDHDCDGDPAPQIDFGCGCSEARHSVGGLHLWMRR